MKAPKNGVRIRMYRQGHGDCFLLAFDQENSSERPYYVLIDCGYKPGSQNYLPNHSFKNIVDDISQSTDKSIDLVIITHEHQDHVNGFWKKRSPYFKDIEIKEAWFAWTEDPNDRLANQLRRRHRDQLLGLISARNKLHILGSTNINLVERLDSLISLETGGEYDDTFRFNEMGLAASDPSKSSNKQSMKLVTDKAEKKNGVKYLNPGDSIELNSETNVKAYVLGPPRHEDLLTDEDPREDESFPVHQNQNLSFIAAAKSDDKTNIGCPFRKEYQVHYDKAFGHGFFKERYGEEKDGIDLTDKEKIPNNADWRRINENWLYTAENLALKLNTGINNTSLVLAFELKRSGKVLLFVGDAQRGNWNSWQNLKWDKNGESVNTKDLLKRTVLYKVGHHGSHNATLKGTRDDNYPNLSWMGLNDYESEFTAMITAVNKWAIKKRPPWRHPLPSIEKALYKKTRGKTIQMDKALQAKPQDVSKQEWDSFKKRVEVTDLFVDYEIYDKK